MKTLSYFIALIGIASLPSPGLAHEEDGAYPSEAFGTVHFATSCTQAAQAKIDLAVAMLHSFAYRQSKQVFESAAQEDATCGIAHWGEAMTWFHQIWAPPTPAELKSGYEALGRAKTVSAKTERERAYIAAVGSFFQDFEATPHPARVKAYVAAMRELYLAYPEDKEAGVFYALALDAAAISISPNDKTYSQQKAAAAILERLGPNLPNHPGVAHYLIHSYDYPSMAMSGLMAARSYAKIAPASAHALHMPSHIFTRLGYWDEAIQTDLNAAATAKQYIEKVSPGAESFERLHSMDYLVYAYLQSAQDNKARVLRDECLAVGKTDAQNIGAAYALAAIPARHAIERRQWAEAASLAVRPADFPWERFMFAEAITHFARAMGAVHLKDFNTASQEIARLDTLKEGLAAKKDVYWSTQVEIQRQTASAWLAFFRGETGEALRQMRVAADLEGTTEKNSVTPGSIVPARELLAEMLVEAGQAPAALLEYEASLAVAPNRFNGLYGAAHAAELAGDRGKAAQLYAKLLQITASADIDRPELIKARTYTANR
jgi:hypothetical protein